jgi:hypothetical protein
MTTRRGIFAALGIGPFVAAAKPAAKPLPGESVNIQVDCDTSKAIEQIRLMTEAMKELERVTRQATLAMERFHKVAPKDLDLKVFLPDKPSTL